MKDSINYIDIDARKVSADINTIFPGWDGNNEKVCVFSPHDDDAIIGAGYAIEAAIEAGAEVYIFIFCCGDAGYSYLEQKDEIVEIRKAETVKAYQKIGVKKENIIRFEYSDFSALQNIGWKLVNGSEGSFKKVITKLRELKITRVLVPNHNREHIDHLAVNIIGSYDSPQAGDPILVDWAEPNTVKSVLEYSVWADFSPEDALVCNRSSKLRANRIIKVNKAFEEKIREGIKEYKSQGEIIKGLIASRDERLSSDGQYIELYISFDPRPKLDYKPYLEFLEKI
ncbi:MAG TPA: PIG-L family deacetylase [Clostridiaceae bacterium]|nr:PIG-L family deacetylase [Clostridiaceae bacterium]